MAGQFIISLDLELLWGVRDHADRASYGANILGARAAIPRILELFLKYKVSATWAAVGFLFCGTRDELMNSLPPAEMRPTYQNGQLSNYRYLDEVGRNETEDPFYFGASLIKRIAETVNQEIATHTMSHYYCLEAGQENIQFEADLTAAIDIASRHSIDISSIVFPRNQFARDHLKICQRLGITTYRGTPGQWLYRPAPGNRQTTLRRAGRLLDAHTGMLDTSFAMDAPSSGNVPASHFLRPYSGKLTTIHPLHRRAIKRGMDHAAKSGRGYHLWWHPHNFGTNIDANLGCLEEILCHYRRLNDNLGFVSRSMAEVAR